MSQQIENQLPDYAIQKAKNLVIDAEIAIVVSLIPILGLAFILRLVQWYLLRKQFPVLASGDAGEHALAAKGFQEALFKLWFAVLLWPVVILIVAICLLVAK